MGNNVKQTQQEPSTDSVEFSMWLGTYRERMRLAGSEDQQEPADNAGGWSDRPVRRRAALA